MRYRRKSWVRCGGGSVLACLVLLGCAVTPEDETTIRFWAIGREGEVVQRLMPEFERRHPHLRVQVQQIPWSAAHEKLLTAYVGDAMPDVFQLGNTWIPEFVALDALLPLDPYVSGSSAVQVADYFAGVLDGNIIDGRMYGVPWYVDTRLLFYRTDILEASGFAEPPETWSVWRETMMRVREHADAGAYAILLPLTEWQVPVILAMQRGATLLRDNDQYGDFRSAPFRDAFEFYLDLFRAGLAPRSGETQIANLYQDFAAGYFAFFITGPWNIGEFRQRLPAAVADRWSTAAMPSPNDTQPGLSLAGGASLVLLRGSPRAKAAWTLIEYLSEPAQQIEFHRLTGDLPARRTAWTAAALPADRYAHAFWQQLQRVQALPKIPEWERIANKISQYAEAAIRGDLSTEAALRALDADVDAILEKRRWLRQRPHTDEAMG